MVSLDPRFAALLELDATVSVENLAERMARIGELPAPSRLETVEFLVAFALRAQEMIDLWAGELIDTGAEAGYFVLVEGDLVEQLGTVPLAIIAADLGVLDQAAKPGVSEGPYPALQELLRATLTTKTWWLAGELADKMSLADYFTGI